MDTLVLRLVKRQRLAAGVCPTRTSLVLVEVRAMLTAAILVSLVMESGTGAESSRMSLRLVTL